MKYPSINQDTCKGVIQALCRICGINDVVSHVLEIATKSPI